MAVIETIAGSVQEGWQEVQFGVTSMYEYLGSGRGRMARFGAIALSLMAARAGMPSLFEGSEEAVLADGTVVVEDINLVSAHGDLAADPGPPPDPDDPQLRPAEPSLQPAEPSEPVAPPAPTEVPDPDPAEPVVPPASPPPAHHPENDDLRPGEQRPDNERQGNDNENREIDLEAQPRNGEYLWDFLDRIGVPRSEITPAIHEALDDVRAQGGHVVEEHGSGEHWWVEIDGNSKPSHVWTILRPHFDLS